MKILSVGLIFCTVTCLLRTGYSKPELQLLSIIFRHGDRAPNAEAMFPTDPNYDYDFFPVGHGGLTNSGKLRMYKLGEFLREKYEDFLGDVYHPELVSARSTDYSRTKMSLQLVLAALFPPSHSQKWHGTLNWQPVYFSYVPKPQDDLLATTLKSRYLLEKNRVTMLPDVQARFSDLGEFMSKLTKLTGKNITGSFDMTQIYDTLLSEYMMNLTLPSWANEMFPNGQLLEAALLFYDIITYDTSITESLAGKLMSKIQRDMLASRDEKMNERRTKLFLYSAHETNIVGVLRALNVYKTHLPFYSSAVIVELLKEDSEYYVKVNYYPGNSSAVELQLPGCLVLCPLEKYTLNVKDVLELAEKRETLNTS